MRQFPVVAITIIATGCANPAASRPEWRVMKPTPGEVGLVADTASFITRDSLRLRAWWIPAATPASPRATVVLAHGSGTNRSGMLSRAAFLVRAGFNVLALDLRAHGESEGKYMTPGWLEADDIRAAVAWAKRRTAGLPVVVLGHSYGAVASLQVGADTGIAAVIADAPFRSYEAMIHNAIAAAKGDKRIPRGQRWAMRMMSIPGFSALAMRRMQSAGVVVPRDSARASFAVARLRTPTLFIAGERDSIAPAMDVRLLYDSAATQVKGYVELPGATHRTFGDAPDLYAREVLAFLNRVMKVY